MSHVPLLYICHLLVAAQRVFLSSTNPTPCFGDTVNLICYYPDVMEKVNGTFRYIVTTPSWRVDSKPIFPDEDVVYETRINQTASRLRVRIDTAIFTGDPVFFTCFLLLMFGGEDSDSTVVNPQGGYMYTDVALYEANVLYNSITMHYILCTNCNFKATMWCLSKQLSKGHALSVIAELPCVLSQQCVT